MTTLEIWTREEALRLSAKSGREPLDLSLGIPAEPPPQIALIANDQPSRPAIYPLSAGSPEFRAEVVRYLKRLFKVEVPVSAVGACAGSKEFISTTPLLLRLARGERAKGRDVALVPALGYPPYEFGARLAGLRVERAPTDDEHQLALEEIPEELAARVLYMWVNSPSNPTGAVQRHMAEILRWARKRDIVILSDEAYSELSWKYSPETALANGLDNVLALHSLSKRSNAPGLRMGFYAGDPELVRELLWLRRETGLIAAEASQRTAVRMLADDSHAADLHRRTAAKVAGLVELCNAYGLRCVYPDGALFVWAETPEENGVHFARKAAEHAGLIVAAGSSYGPTGGSYVRLAAVHEPGLVEERLRVLADAGHLSGNMA